MANLRDARILNDYIISISGIQKIGTVPMLTLPDIEVEVETYRGGGMDGSVEIPQGINKMEMSFDMFTWDEQIWTELGFGPGSMDVPITFNGYTLTPSGIEGSVVVTTLALVKAIKIGSIEPGKQVKMAVSLAIRKYTHEIDGNIVTDIDIFNKKFFINGVDKSAKARQLLGFTY